MVVELEKIDIEELKEKEKRLDAVIELAEFTLTEGYHLAYLAGFNSAMQDTLRIAKGEQK